jgi:hypothetical protein
MMMKQIALFPPFRLNAGFLFAAFAAVSLFSCSAAVTGRLEQDASGALSLKAALEPKTAALVRSFGALGGGPSGGAKGPLLDSQAINRSLRAAPGIKTTALKNTAADSIEGTIAVSKSATSWLRKRGTVSLRLSPPAFPAAGLPCIWTGNRGRKSSA